jgi:hypothetical protein
MADQPTLQFAPSEQPPPPMHRWRIAVVALLSVLVVLLPVAAYLLLRSGNPETAAPGGTAPSSPAAPTVTTSPSPSPPAATAPNGRISLATLGDSYLTIPPWPADNVQGPSGRLHFHDGVVRIDQSQQGISRTPPTGTEVMILSATYGDVDRDGA